MVDMLLAMKERRGYVVCYDLFPNVLVTADVNSRLLS